MHSLANPVRTASGLRGDPSSHHPARIGQCHLPGNGIAGWRGPPALALIGIVAMGLLFGTFGVVLAVPLTAAIMTAVKVFYIRDTLHEEADIPEESPL